MELIYDTPPAHGRSFSAGSARSFLNSVVRQKLKGLLKPYEDLSKLMCMGRIQSLHRHSCISANVNTGERKVTKSVVHAFRTVCTDYGSKPWLPHLHCGIPVRCGAGSTE